MRTMEPPQDLQAVTVNTPFGKQTITMDEFNRRRLAGLHAHYANQGPSSQPRAQLAVGVKVMLNERTFWVRKVKADGRVDVEGGFADGITVGQVVKIESLPYVVTRVCLKWAIVGLRPASRPILPAKLA